MTKVEYVFDSQHNHTLILVWRNIRVIHKETIKGEVSKEEQIKLTKKFKRKFKEKHVK